MTNEGEGLIVGGDYVPGASRRDDIRIIVCNKKMKETPDSCTGCRFAFQCNAMFQTADESLAKTIRAKKLREGHDVMFTYCECKENTTEVRKTAQVLINRKDILFSGGKNESDNLWEQRGGNAAS